MLVLMSGKLPLKFCPTPKDWSPWLQRTATLTVILITEIFLIIKEKMHFMAKTQDNNIMNQ